MFQYKNTHAHTNVLTVLSHEPAAVNNYLVLNYM
jgi:hypothetical protein